MKEALVNSIQNYGNQHPRQVRLPSLCKPSAFFIGIKILPTQRSSPFTTLIHTHIKDYVLPIKVSQSLKEGRNVGLHLSLIFKVLLGLSSLDLAFTILVSRLAYFRHHSLNFIVLAICLVSF